jgi:hypothetical protein
LTPRSGAELQRFALKTLPAMQLEDGSFCHELARGDPTPRGRSLRYSAIVLLGLLRAEARGRDHPFDTARLKALLIDELDAPELTPGDIGLLLWADARSGTEATDRLLGALRRSLELAALADLEGMQVAWIASGLVETRLKQPGADLDAPLANVVRQLLEHNRSPSGLLFHRGRGSRRRFPNFAAEIYALPALVRVGGILEDPRAGEAARRIGDRLIELQRSNGGWPWLFDAQRGTVVEPFELYSVHQDAMAPMGLFDLSETTGDPRYREAALRGLDWIWDNELGRPMLDPDAGMLYRSIRRRPPLDRGVLYTNTLGSYLGRAPLARWNGLLELNPTDRPYHLGWVLEAWSGREELATSSSSSA